MIKRIKSIIALCVLMAVIASCILSAAAAISSTTYVIWNARETEASAVTDGTGPLNVNFYVEAQIQSMSTMQEAYSLVTSSGATTSLTATAGPVAVTYPSPIPLVTYWGGHGVSY